MPDITTAFVPGGAGELCESILAELPEWFGIAQANTDYIDHAERQPGVIASIDCEPVGVTTVVRHSPMAAEIYLMAVRPHHHRSGVGRAMLDCAETQLATDGVKFLQVKTLSATDPDPGYAKTRTFYLAAGFGVLEEHPTLWGPDNPALQLIKSITAL